MDNLTIKQYKADKELLELSIKALLERFAKDHSCKIKNIRAEDATYGGHIIIVKTEWEL